MIIDFGRSLLVVHGRRFLFSVQRHMSAMSLQGYKAVNEPMYDFRPGSTERAELEAAITRLQGDITDVPIVIGEEEIRTGDTRFQVQPCNHQKQIAKFYYANAELIQKAIDVSQAARRDWERRSYDDRANVFLRAADLISKKHRMDILAATMLGQGKNMWQAEIDAAAELVDFYRFNAQFGREVTQYSPLSPDPDVTNSSTYRGMEGFWAAITPFNFTAIGGHLSAAPTFMGNVVLWKPSDTAILSNWLVFNVLREAGLPPGVINFLPADGPVFGDVITSSPHLAGINFTGSTRTFKLLWKLVANNLDVYRSYPRLIGECGGKNYHFVHKSANVDSVVIGTIKSAFEYAGQKCSACSRVYVPQSLWPRVRDGMLAIHKDIKTGSGLDPQTLVSPVIDDKSFSRIKEWLSHAKSSPDLTVLAGGNCDDSTGYFIEPTIIETKNPLDKIMSEEIFGPVVTVYPYPDDQYRQIAELANSTSKYGLTGAIYAQDQAVLDELTDILRDSAGNFYVNDKSTGSVVGQQPFGGARLSGTNDKAGGPHYLLRFTSTQSTKTTTSVPTDWRHPSMAK